MAGNTANISIRMDADLKAQADALFGEMGMNLSTAFNIFVRQAIREQRFPIDIKVGRYNDQTVAALLEAERLAKDPKAQRYSDVEEALRELKR
jgi:DNA-damage-inducible protein J